MNGVRTRDRAATEARILAAALQLFAGAAYDRVTVRAIAEAADANPALISRYFGSKQELFGEMVADAIDFEPLLDGPLPGLPRRLAEQCLRKRDTRSRMLMEALNRSAAVPELRVAIADSIDTHFIQPLARMLGGPDARERALVVTALMNGVGGQRRSLGPRGLPVGSDAQPALDVLIATFASALGLPR